ncbi:MAG: hypothetical protein DWQ07_12955 [Chloroflexi bacterium]|nr:MAG: hypothetical protein DWQ07_12955 [Chloroflexota bacterium]MBL1196949.1 hypothetical protein [Chloroflexota bacterium]
MAKLRDPDTKNSQLIFYTKKHMQQSDLDFIIESLLIAIEADDSEGLQIMFDWGTEMMGGSAEVLVSKVQAPILNMGKQQAYAVLERHLNSLSQQ